MVFGKMGDRSATGPGVGFTRSRHRLQRVYRLLVHGQGEDVVSGVRTRSRFASREGVAEGLQAASRRNPRRGGRRTTRSTGLRVTIQDEKSTCCQTRSGKRTGLRRGRDSATDLVAKRSCRRKPPCCWWIQKRCRNSVTRLRIRRVGQDSRAGPKGIPASTWRRVRPGGLHRGRSGGEWNQTGHTGHSVRKRTRRTWDIHGMHVAQWHLTATGG